MVVVMCRQHPQHDSVRNGMVVVIDGGVGSDGRAHETQALQLVVNRILQQLQPIVKHVR